MVYSLLFDLSIVSAFTVLDYFTQLQQIPHHYSRNMEVITTAKLKNKENAFSAAFAVVDVAGDGISPTVSFKNDPNLEVLAND